MCQQSNTGLHCIIIIQLTCATVHAQLHSLTVLQENIEQCNGHTRDYIETFSACTVHNIGVSAMS